MKWLKVLMVVYLCITVSSCSEEIPTQENHSSDMTSEIGSVKQTEATIQSHESTLPERAIIPIPETAVIEVPLPMVFRIDEIDEAMADEMMGNSYHVNEVIQIGDLRYIETGFYGFDGLPHQGALVVHKAIAEDVLDIFIELYDLQYPFESMTPIDYYGGDDDASMRANNTSAFNYRVVAGTNRLSRHAYGLAIDINPLMNPWVTSHGVYPVEGMIYADRSVVQEGMIVHGDPCYEAFVSRGFEWGGDWNSSKDYQHFDRTISGIND